MPVPLPSGIDLPYHEGLAAHRLSLQRCGDCGGWQWPAEVLCHRCCSFGMRWEDVPPEGTLFSWTRVWHPAREGLENAVPYLVAVVEIPAADGARLIGNLLGDPARTPVIGERLYGVFEDHPAEGGGYALLQWQRPSG
jgi:uncharacterized OB-fold protein